MHRSVESEENSESAIYFKFKIIEGRQMVRRSIAQQTSGRAHTARRVTFPLKVSEAIVGQQKITKQKTSSRKEKHF